jgi:hypothetical protein
LLRRELLKCGRGSCMIVLTNGMPTTSDREDIGRLSEWPFAAPILGRLILLILAGFVSLLSHVLLPSLSL